MTLDSLPVDAQGGKRVFAGLLQFGKRVLEWLYNLMKQQGVLVLASFEVVTSYAFEHVELPAKLLDYFLRSNISNINQWKGDTHAHHMFALALQLLARCLRVPHIQDHTQNDRVQASRTGGRSVTDLDQ